MRNAGILALILLWAAPVLAQEEPLVAASIDLSGVWIMEPHRDGPGGLAPLESLRCDYHYAARLNRAQFGTTWLELEHAGAEVEQISFGEFVYKIKYRGVLHHFHGYARLVTEGEEQWFDPYCEVVELVYDVEGELRIPPLDFNVMGPVRNPPSFRHPSQGGVSAYGVTNEFHYRTPYLFADASGDVLNLGILGGNHANTGQSPGDCTYDTTQPFDAMSLSQCQPISAPPVRWRRGARPEESPTGPLRGRLLEALPDGTLTGETLSGGRIRVFDQRSRLKLRTDETNEQWAAYLDSHRRRWILVAETTAGEDGTWEAGSVPLFRRVPVGVSNSGWVTSDFAVEVSNVEKTELDEHGQAHQVLFATALVNDARPPAEVEVAVRASDAIGLKRMVANRLEHQAPVQYGPPEAMAHDHLDALESGTLALTEAREEGVRRAVWSEHAFATSADFARRELELMMKALGELLGELIDKLPLHSRSLKEQADAVGSLRSQSIVQAVPALGLTGARANPAAAKEAADWAQRILDNNPAVQKVEALNLIKRILKAHFALIGTGLVRLGLAPSHAAALKSYLERWIFVGLDLAVSKNASSLIKQHLVSRLLPEALEALYDSSFPAAYSTLTRPDLEASVERMRTWAVADRAAYVLDREEAVGHLNDFAAASTKIVQGIEMARGAAEGLGAGADVLELGGVAVPAFKTAAGFAKLTKHVLNAGSVAAPLGHVYFELPKRTRTAADAAFGIRTFPLEGFPFPGEGSAPNEALRDDLTASQTSLAASLRAVAELLRSAANTMAAFEKLAGDGDEDVLSSVTRWELARRRVGAHLSGAYLPPDRTSGTLSLAEQDAQQVLLELGRASELLTEVVTGAYLGHWQENTPGVDARLRDARMALLSAATLAARAKDSYDAAWRAVGDGVVLPTVIVEELRLASETTGRAEIAMSPESFGVTARLVNLSTVAAPALAAKLVLHGPEGVASIVDGASQPVTSLAGWNEGTGRAVELTWQLLVTGAASTLDTLSLEVVLEPANEALVTVGLERILPLAEELFDADGDGLPDAWEREHGLDPLRDDAYDDLDDDGLTNLAELIAGTRPGLADSDGDGLSDGDEVLGGARGFVTDPLERDTDGDGLDDGLDPAPLDGDPNAAGANAEEPKVAVSPLEARVFSSSPAATFQVQNAGGGELRWVASTDAPDLVELKPAEGTVSSGGSFLVHLPGGERPKGVNAPVRVRVRDVSGAVRDEQSVWLWRGEIPDGGIAGWDFGVDAGSPDGGGESGADGGGDHTDGGDADSGGEVPSRDAGCGCGGSGVGALSLLAFAAFLRRRKRGTAGPSVRR